MTPTPAAPACGWCLKKEATKCEILLQNRFCHAGKSPYPLFCSSLCLFSVSVCLSGVLTSSLSLSGQVNCQGHWVINKFPNDPINPECFTPCKAGANPSVDPATCYAHYVVTTNASKSGLPCACEQPLGVKCSGFIDTSHECTLPPAPAPRPAPAPKGMSVINVIGGTPPSCGQVTMATKYVPNAVAFAQGMGWTGSGGTCASKGYTYTVAGPQGTKALPPSLTGYTGVTLTATLYSKPAGPTPAPGPSDNLPGGDSSKSTCGTAGTQAPSSPISNALPVPRVIRPQYSHAHIAD